MNQGVSSFFCVLMERSVHKKITDPYVFGPSVSITLGRTVRYGTVSLLAWTQKLIIKMVTIEMRLGPVYNLAITSNLLILLAGKAGF
jgi:hypothetical protein